MKNKKKEQPKEIFLSRTKCDCMAQKHDLVNNCLGCGKIVCAKEGEGKCLYCGALVRSRQGGVFMEDNEEFFPTLSKEQKKKAEQQFSKAVQHKNILVQRDKQQFQNQNIYDEQMDYYDLSQNKWIDQSEREKAIERILEKNKYIEQEQFKTKVSYDPITQQFVREQFQFNQEQFKEQSKKFYDDNQKKQMKQKEERTKTNWDERILRNQKMRDLCKQMLDTKRQPQEVDKLKNKRTNKVVEIVLQE